MRIGDVSRARRFSNPARIRWYAFHRSVRFALRMLKPGLQTPATDPSEPLPCLGFPIEEDAEDELTLPVEEGPN